MNEENLKSVNNNFGEENIENEPPVKEKTKRNPTDVAIPTESPAKPGNIILKEQIHIRNVFI